MGLVLGGEQGQTNSQHLERSFNKSKGKTQEWRTSLAGDEENAFTVSITSTDPLKQNTEVEGAKPGGSKSRVFLSGICTWYCSHMKFTHFSTIPKERQEVLFLRNPLFSAADPRKPLKVNPLLLSSTTAGRILACPSPAISSVFPQTLLLGLKAVEHRQVHHLARGGPS